ncbi:MAG: sodium:solute symporter, partial [Planctomycetota bacterium]|nr:sodium:solute symporter [Planctomycetota bacterium]
GGLSWNAPEPFAYGACLVLTGLFFAAKLWRLRITTMADFLRGRFGPSSERLAAILLLPSSLLWAAAQIRAFGQVVAANADGAVSVEAAIGVAAGIAIIYTVAGGLLADVYTDVVQSAALLVGIAALAIAVWCNLPAPDAAAAAAGSLAPSLPTASWLGQLEQWAIPICGSVVAQEVISRALAGRSASVARNAAIAGGLAYIAVGAIPLTLGALGPRLLPGLQDPESVLPELSRELLPDALNLLFAGALISAILSTVDSCLLVASSLVARNLTPRTSALDAPMDRLRVARWAVVGGGLIAYALANSDCNVADLVEEASGFGSAGMFVLACAGLYGTRGRSLAANATLITGLVVWIIGRHIAPAAVPHPYLMSLAAAAGAFVLGCALERRRSAPARDQ